MQLCAQSAFGQSGESRDLLVAVAEDVVEHEDAPRAGRQRGDGALEVYRLLHVDDARVACIERRRWLVTRGLATADAGGATAVAANLHEERVDGDAMEPGRERRIAAKGPDTSPCVDKDVLGELGGVALVGGKSQRERVDTAHVGSIECLERADVAAAGAVEERALGVAV